MGFARVYRTAENEYYNETDHTAVEFCDVLIVNKTDLISHEDQRTLKAMLHRLNPRARIITSHFGNVPLDQVLDTGLFDFDQAAQAPGWLKELRGEHQEVTFLTALRGTGV